MTDKNLRLRLVLDPEVYHNHKFEFKKLLGEMGYTWAGDWANGNFHWAKGDRLVQGVFEKAQNGNTEQAELCFLMPFSESDMIFRFWQRRHDTKLNTRLWKSVIPRGLKQWVGVHISEWLNARKGLGAGNGYVEAAKVDFYERLKEQLDTKYKMVKVDEMKEYLKTKYGVE